MKLSLQRTCDTHVAPTTNVLRLAAMFGLGVDEQRTRQLVPPVTLDLAGGQIVFITGPSGSGKSTLLRCIAARLADRDDARVIDFHALDIESPHALADCFAPLSLERTCALLSLAGLNDAFVMLRMPGELSDGQRYRYRLARAVAAVEQMDHADQRLCVVLADEFAATLDRTTAAIIARNIRRWVSRPRSRRVCFVCATTHDDLLEALSPDVLIEKSIGEVVHVHTREEK